MWIFFGILLGLAFLIAIILMLPIYIIIKSDAEDSFYFRYKFLGKTYGENPDPNNPIVKTLKSASGISRLEKDSIKKDIQDNNLLKTLKEDFVLVTDLLKELLWLVKHCRAKVFRLKIVCSDDDPAEASIKYGACCMAVFPILDYLFSYIRMGKSAKKIDISCDFEGGNSMFAFETLLVLRMHQVLGALFRTAMAEVKRSQKKQESA